MFLRRITDHVKSQNWFAVGLELVILVLGVFIGMQVSNLNEERVQATAFERKLIAVQLEMSENLERFESARSSLQRQFEDIAVLREILADPAGNVEDKEIHRLLRQSIPAIHLYPKRNALDVVLEHELFSELADQTLVGEIEGWDAVLADLLRKQSDEINFRDGFQSPYFAENLPLAAIFLQSSDTIDLVAPARFAVSREEMAGNPVLDNILVVRQLSNRQNFDIAGDLIEYTQRIIEKISAREKP